MRAKRTLLVYEKDCQREGAGVGQEGRAMFPVVDNHGQPEERKEMTEELVDR